MALAVACQKRSSLRDERAAPEEIDARNESCRISGIYQSFAHGSSRAKRFEADFSSPRMVHDPSRNGGGCSESCASSAQCALPMRQRTDVHRNDMQAVGHRPVVRVDRATERPARDHGRQQLVLDDRKAAGMHRFPGGESGGGARDSRDHEAFRRHATDFQSAVPEGIPDRGPDHDATEGLKRAGYGISPVDRTAGVCADDRSLSRAAHGSEPTNAR